MNRAPVPWGLVAAICAVRLALYGLSAGPLAWGYMSDELYYVACAKRLAWGYVDHPPFSLAVLAAQRALLGDSLLALRLTPALSVNSPTERGFWRIRSKRARRVGSERAARASS